MASGMAHAHSSLPAWRLMHVDGSRCLGGNERFAADWSDARSPDTPWPKVLGIRDADTSLAWLEKARIGGPAHVARAERDGEPRWWRLRVATEADDGRKTIDIEDVTEEQEALERIRIEGQHFHALIARSAEGISLFDTGARILWESPSNKRIHGWESWEMEGKNLFDFCHPDDMARAMPRFEHLAQAPGIVETEVVRFKHKEGHWIYLEGTVINATDDPRVGALVNNFREVTGRLEAEKELRRAKNAAEEAQRLQQHFLTNLSHEFKTPLTLIRGPLMDLAEGRVSLTSAASVIGRVLRNVDRLGGLMSELMDLVKLDAGTFGLKISQHDLVEFVRRELDSFAPVVAEKSIQLEFEAPEGLGVFIDAAKLEKVVTNLVGNAMRYSPSRGTVTVKIEPRESDDGPGAVRVAVSDEGPGMDKATRSRVFERFFQADTSLAREHEGMGIGLALAQEMVEMHGGRVGVESEPGKGSTFYFELILGCEHFDPDDIDTAAGAEPRPHTVGGTVATAKPVGLVAHAAHRPRLLLVEDNEDMRAYLRMNLDPYYLVSEAVDGKKAWDAMDEFAPEIIVSDVMMPHVDGLDLCRRLKAAPRWRDVPVLLLSAKGSVDHRVEGLQAGADDYVAKPFSVAELLQRLRSRVPWGMSEDSGGDVWREKLERCIAENLSRADFDVGSLAQRLAYSPRQLQRRVREHFGLSPSGLLLHRRLERGREFISEKRFETLAEVAHAVGMSPGYFSRRYRRKFGNDLS
jgi:PAS domain S-box-containing protein